MCRGVPHEVRIVAEGGDLLANNERKDTWHDITAVDVCDDTLRELGLLVEVVLAKVNIAFVEVAHTIIIGSFVIEAWSVKMKWLESAR